MSEESNTDFDEMQQIAQSISVLGLDDFAVIDPVRIMARFRCSREIADLVKAYIEQGLKHTVVEEDDESEAAPAFRSDMSIR